MVIVFILSLIQKQQAVEDVVNNDSYFKDSGSDRLMQTGVVLINPKTGGVPALVGGRGIYQFYNLIMLRN